MSVEVLTKNQSEKQENFGQKILIFTQNHLFLIFSLLVLAFAVVYINPFNETSISDDWAYVWSTHRLYDTGTFQPHPWATASALFQAYWGLLFTFILGFSFGTLHISTIVLVVIGVVSLYLLAQEHGLNSTTAGIVAFCLVASPIFLYMTPTFMSDVPAVCLQILGMLLYTRGLKRNSMVYMLAGSLVCLADIFVRQTIVALVVGLGIIFLLDKDRLKRWKLYATGVLLPVVGGMITVASILSNKSDIGAWSAAINKTGQIKFISHPDTFIPAILLWRPSIYLIYMGFYSLPLVIGIIISLFAGKRKEPGLNLKVVLFFTVFVVGALVYQVFVLNKNWQLPYIGSNLEVFTTFPLWGQLTTLLAVPGAIIICSVTWSRAGNWKRWSALPLEQRYLDATTLIFLVYYILYYQMVDRYLFTLLPFVLIVMGRFLQPRLEGMKKFVIGMGVAVVIMTSMVTHFDQAQLAAAWKASDYIHSQGVDPLDIYGHWGWYSTYNFSDYLKTTADIGDINLVFDKWLPERAAKAKYRLTTTTELAGAGWQLEDTFYYDTGFFQQWPIYVFKRPNT